MQQQTFQIKNIADTKNFAKCIANTIVADFVIALNGELGAGKTTLVREIIKTYGITENIKSPTFTYVEPYKTSQGEIYHFDLYRFNDSENWLDYGFDEYFNSLSICFIEWAINADGYIPRIDWEINLSVSESPESRIFKITALTKSGEKCLNQLIKLVEHFSN